MYIFINPSLGPFTVVTKINSLAKQLHIKIPYLHDESPRQRSAMFFMFVFYIMALLMKCMLSFNNYQANMEQQEHINVRKFLMDQKPKEKSKFIG